jgi:hypothetical protein
MLYKMTVSWSEQNDIVITPIRNKYDFHRGSTKLDQKFTCGATLRALRRVIFASLSFPLLA